MGSVTVDGERLSYREVGEAFVNRPALLLVHMAGGSSVVFLPLLRRLAGQRRVIALDLPGHGRSEGPGRSDIAAYARLVAGSISALELDCPAGLLLGGHSMGGAVAMSIAGPGGVGHAAPWLRGLVLMCTGAKMRRGAPLDEALAQGSSATQRFLARHSWSPQTPLLERRKHEAIFRESAIQVTRNDFNACHHFDAMDSVSGIRVPCLVACGADDQLTPPYFSHYLAARISDATLCELPDAGHLLPLEQPLALAEALERWASGIC